MKENKLNTAKRNEAGEVPVTKAFLPPIDEYMHLLERAWNNRWLTNRGELTLELEAKLKQYLDIDNIIITNNGTLPLQIAIKLLGGGGEIITTPFSYVATAAAISWTNCTPVFVDIDSDYFSIDESKIEAVVTPKTKAILATHVFGNPVNIEAISKIASKHGLKVIYDAAHCFGVNYQGQSIFNFGDVSTCSFHATKLFHTGEGGAMFSSDPELRQQLFYSHNFGHKNQVEFYGLGINAKISELQSAMGLSVLPYMERILEERKDISKNYDELLNLGKLRKLKIRPGTDWNYSYYPVLFDSEVLLLKALSALNKEGIFPRRYFYPSLNKLSFLNVCDMPVSESVAKSIVCLPLYSELRLTDIERIAKIINNIL